MGKKGRTGVLKRLREAKKAEKAALKRELMKDRKPAQDEEPREMVATEDDMAGYGFPVDEEEEAEESR